MRPRISRKSDGPKKQETGRGRETGYRKNNDDNKPTYNSESRKRKFSSRKEDSFTDKPKYSRDKDSRKETFENKPERKSYSKSNSGFNDKPERKKYSRSNESFDSKTEKRSYSKSNDSFEAKPERRSYSKRDDSFEDKPERKKYSRSNESFDSKPEKRSYSKSNDSFKAKPERKSYSKPNDSFEDKQERKRYSGSENENRERKTWDRNPGFKKRSNDSEKKGFKPYNKESSTGRSDNFTDENRFERRSERPKRYGKDDKSFDQERPKRENKKNDSFSDKQFGRAEKKYGKAVISKERKSTVSKELDYSADNQRFHKKPKLEKNTVRLNKYIANAGICSRREADELIKAGVVTVNGKIITEMGYQINPGDIVHYGSQKLSTEKPVYILLNKPKDYITTLDDPQKRKTVLELIAGACKERVYPVGRLDRNTTGLLLLTNDGEMAAKLTHPKYGVKKIYHVELTKNVKHSDLKQILEGVRLDDGEIVKADDISYTSEDQNNRKEIGIEIHSGQNRVVRRIFESLDYEVAKLDRVYFAGLTKKDLPRGRWRFLTEKEIVMLKMLKA